MRWMAIALISPRWHASPLSAAPHDISDGIRFAPLPDWFVEQFQDEHSKVELGEHLWEKGAFCLCTEYEADPASGSVEGAAHERALRSLHRASTLLWLSRRTSFGFDRTVLLSREEDGWMWKDISANDDHAPLSSYASTDLEARDFAFANSLATGLATASPDSLVNVAMDAIGMALVQRSWPLRCVSLWLALEGLFGASNAQETTFRLCQRIALFTLGRGDGAVERFKRVKELYAWRSKAVHGLHLQKLNPDTAISVLDDTELILQEALRKILCNPELLKEFDSKGRETYLDNLALL